MFAIRFALRNLWRSKARTLVTLLGVSALLFLISFLVAIVGGLGSATETDASQLRLITRNQVSLTFWIPESYWSRIKGLPHVREVCTSNWFGGTYIDARNFFARFFVEPDCFFAVMPEVVVPADQAAAWKADRQGALVHEKLARKFGWKLGDKIAIQGDIYPVNVELNVRAIYAGAEEALYFHRDYVEESLGRPGNVGTYTILVDDAKNLSSVAKAVDALFTDSEAPTKTETEKAFQAGFAQMFGNVKGLVRNLTLIIALTVLLTAGNTMAMAVRERTREVAVLKAIGFSPSRIVLMILAESTMLAALAALIGIGGFWLPSWYIFVVKQARLPMVWFPLTLPMDLGLLLCAGALLVGVLTGLVPALLAARRPTADGLRST